MIGLLNLNYSRGFIFSRVLRRWCASALDQDRDTRRHRLRWTVQHYSFISPDWKPVHCAILLLLLVYTEGKLLGRLSNGGNVVVAEGYVFEFERRGYLRAGAFVPEVVMERPDLVKIMPEEFVHAGSDVVFAFTYYGHREKLRLIGKEDQLEAMNRKALSIARDVAKATGTLFAGNICNSTVYRRDDETSIKVVEGLFEEQVEWAVDKGVDFIVGETSGQLGEAMLAWNVSRNMAKTRHGECLYNHALSGGSSETVFKSVPAVVTIVAAGHDVTYDGIPLGEACRQLEDAGAAVVGLNCSRGPESMLPAIREVRKVCKGPIACPPVTYRTSQEYPTMQSLLDPKTGQLSFPNDLPAQLCSRREIANFAASCKDVGVNYIGLCCGNCSHYTRVVAEVYGRKPPASCYSPDMSQHFMYGDKTKFHEYHTQGMVEFTEVQ